MLRRQVWIANVVIAVAILGAAAVAYAALTWGPTPAPPTPHEEHVAAHPDVPVVTGAYVTGGTPGSDAALETVLRHTLSELVIATDDDRVSGGMSPGPRHALILKLLAPAAVTAHGAELARTWASMISALDYWVYVPRSGRDYDATVATFKEHVRAVSDQLAALGLGYYLEGDIVMMSHEAHAVVYAYRVEDVRFVVASGASRRVLSLRRMDDLGVEHAMMGMQSEDLGDPVLLLDQIDEHVQRKLLPIYEDRKPYPLGDDDWATGNAQATELRALASRVVRAELAAAITPGEHSDRLALVVAASVRRHEAQHGLDGDRDTPQRYPAELAAIIGPLADREGRPLNYPDHCRHELSAYVSQIANDPRTPVTAYFQVATFAFDRHRWGTPESFAGALISEGLARHLGSPVLPVIHDGQIDRARLATAATLIANAAPDAIRAAARATWRDLYGEDLVSIVDK